MGSKRMTPEDYSAEAASLVDGPVPDGADVLVVAGPRHDFLLPELDAVATYLKAGGGVVMLLDPAPLPNVARLLASMGIRLGDDLIFDGRLTWKDDEGVPDPADAAKD